LHRLKSDEIWHFYLGGPLTLVEISGDGQMNKTRMGHDILNNQKLQHVVPAGRWFGAYPDDGTEYSLVGCTLSPGFDFRDFEIGKQDELLHDYPATGDLILKLT